MPGQLKVGGNVIAEHTGVEGAGTVSLGNVTLGGGQLSGFRNLIINGNFRVNQRGAASITATSSAYNYDRWYYDGTYLYQGVEDKNVFNGTYTLSWVDAGSDITASYVVSTDSTAGDGPDSGQTWTTVSNGGNITVNEANEFSKHLWIRFSGTLSNLSKVQVEYGTVATPFEHRPYGVELSLCQRYYEICENSHRAHGNNGETHGGSSLVYKVEKRTAPQITFISYGATRNTLTFQELHSITKHGAGVQYTNASATSSYAYGTLFEVDAEL